MFGMGTGVTLPTKSPENRIIFHFSFQICHLSSLKLDSTMSTSRVIRNLRTGN